MFVYKSGFYIFVLLGNLYRSNKFEESCDSTQVSNQVKTKSFVS